MNQWAGIGIGNVNDLFRLLLSSMFLCLVSANYRIYSAFRLNFDYLVFYRESASDSVQRCRSIFLFCFLSTRWYLKNSIGFQSVTLLPLWWQNKLWTVNFNNLMTTASTYHINRLFVSVCYIRYSNWKSFVIVFLTFSLSLSLAVCLYFYPFSISCINSSFVLSIFVIHFPLRSFLVHKPLLANRIKSLSICLYLCL